MECRPCKKNECGREGHKLLEEEEFDSRQEIGEGLVQFFYHSPSSELPVRDVLDEQKK